METSDRLLFVQNRALRAGAQVSLSRLVTQPSLRKLNPHVILGTKGWLDGFLSEHSIPHGVTPWPSPRSIPARLGGLTRFAKQTVSELHKQDVSIRAIIANDHQDCLPALAIAKAAGRIPVIAILRTPGMTRRDFKKYRCYDCTHLFARGEQLTEKVAAWSGCGVSCMLGSFSDGDMLPAPELPQTMPTRILIAGSEEPRKGFQDFIRALRIVEQKEPLFPALDIVLTGKKSHALEQLTQSGFRSQFEFIGRVDTFQAFVRNFQLAIHPSRAETFGMAPFELILAGVPTMLSSTGSAPTLPVRAPWIFPVESPDILADHMIQIWKNWLNVRPDMRMLQNSILDTYPVSASANALAEKIDEILNLS